MYIVDKNRGNRKNRFDVVAESFLQESGLPFADVLDASAIEHAFIDNGALFAQDDVYSCLLYTSDAADE